MGFNTVAMILNDHISTIREAPKSLTYALTHPPQYGGKGEVEWRNELITATREYGEPNIIGGLNVLPTFHMDDVHFLYAGRNTLERLEVLKFDTQRINLNKRGPKPADYKEVRTVTLILPDWGK